jgi:hypothetical protein
MTTVFGDFVFKISAVVKDAIKGVKDWDEQATKAWNERMKQSKEEKKNVTLLQQTWQNFGSIAKKALAGLGATIMLWSPHIRASLTMIGSHFKALSIYIGELISPAFEFVEKGIGKIVDAWLEWATVREDASKEAGSAGGIWGMLGFSEMQIEEAKKIIADFFGGFVGYAAILTGFITVLGFVRIGVDAFATKVGIANLKIQAAWIKTTLVVMGKILIWIGLFYALYKSINLWSKTSADELDWFEKVLATVGGTIAVTLHNIGQGFWWLANYAGYHIQGLIIWFKKIQLSAEEAKKKIREFFGLDTTRVSSDIEATQMQIWDAVEARTKANLTMIEAEIAIENASKQFESNMEKWWGKTDEISLESKKISEIETWTNGINNLTLEYSELNAQLKEFENLNANLPSAGTIGTPGVEGSNVITKSVNIHVDGNTINISSGDAHKSAYLIGGALGNQIPRISSAGTQYM